MMLGQISRDKTFDQSVTRITTSLKQSTKQNSSNWRVIRNSPAELTLQLDHKDCMDLWVVSFNAYYRQSDGEVFKNLAKDFNFFEVDSSR